MSIPALRKIEQIRVRVLQVRRGVAVERQHPVPVEDVVAERGRSDRSAYFSGADADVVTDRAPLHVGQLGVAIGHRRLPALDRLVDDVDEVDGVAATAPEHLAIQTEHLPNGTCTASVGGCSQPAIAGGEHHRQMQRLRCADDVHHEVGLHPLDAGRSRTRRSLVAYVYAPALVRTMSGSGSPSRFVKPGGNTTSAPSECSSRPAAASRSTTCGQERVVEALADDVVVREQHAELAVQVGPELLGGLDEPVPDRRSSRVVALEQHDSGPCPLGELGIGLEPLRRLLVVLVERLDVELVGVEDAAVDQVLDVDADGRPDAPMWFSRTTSWPRNSSIRTSASADGGGVAGAGGICLATFGAE